MIDGFFEAVDYYEGHGWVAKGWAFDPARPAWRVVVQLSDEQGGLVTAVADLFRPDLLAAGIGDGRHAFEIFLPASLLDAKPHLLQVSDRDSAGPLRDSPRPFLMPRYRGAIDRVAALTLEGWVSDALDPVSATSLDVLVDGVRLFRIDASGHNDGGAVSPRRRFTCHLPVSLCDAQPHQIAIQVTNSMVLLDGCPREIQFSEALVPPVTRRAHAALDQRQAELDQERLVLQRQPLRPLDDVATYARWLAIHDARWVGLQPAKLQTRGRPSFTVMALGTWHPTDLHDLVAALDGSTPDWRLIIGGTADLAMDRRILTLPSPLLSIGSVLGLDDAPFLVFVPAGCRPHRAFLAEMAAALRDGTHDAVYVDEDRIDKAGIRQGPLFKPDWDPDRCLESGYLGTALCARRDVFQAFLRRQPPAAKPEQLLELLLLSLPPVRVHHLPFVLWHRGAMDDPPTPERAQHLSWLFGGEGPIIEPAGPRVRVRHRLPAPAPAITLIMPTRDRLDLLRTAVESILDRTRYPNYRLLILDNGSTDPQTLAYLETVGRGDSVSVMHCPGPFNFSALNNSAVRLAPTPFVGLLNNDLEIIAPDWLDEMMAQACRPDVGAVGAKLLFPDGRIQHGGVIVGFHGVADNAQQSFTADEPGYMDAAVVTQNVSAVTAACLVCRRDTYLRVGGMEAQALKVAFNDVDFCLKLRAVGLRVIWTPHALLYHHESASRGRPASVEAMEREQAEAAWLRQRWRTDQVIDPFYSPNLARTGHSHSDFAWPAPGI